MTLSACHSPSSLWQCHIVLRERRADEAVRAVRIVVEADFERDQSLFAQIDALGRLRASPSPRSADEWPYLPAFTSSSLKPGCERVRARPTRC